MKSIFRINRKRITVVSIIMCCLFFSESSYSENGQNTELVRDVIRDALGLGQSAGGYQPNYTPPPYPVNMPYTMPAQNLGCPMGTMPLQTIYGVMCCNFYGCL